MSVLGAPCPQGARPVRCHSHARLPSDTRPRLPRARHAAGASYVLVGQGNEPVRGWVTGLPSQCGWPLRAPAGRGIETPAPGCRSSGPSRPGGPDGRPGTHHQSPWQPLPAPRPVPPGPRRASFPSFLPQRTSCLQHRAQAAEGPGIRNTAQGGVKGRGAASGPRVLILHRTAPRASTSW